MGSREDTVKKKDLQREIEKLQARVLELETEVTALQLQRITQPAPNPWGPPPEPTQPYKWDKVTTGGKLPPTTVILCEGDALSSGTGKQPSSSATYVWPGSGQVTPTVSQILDDLLDKYAGAWEQLAKS
jgi:hypothetical protein